MTRYKAACCWCVPPLVVLLCLLLAVWAKTIVPSSSFTSDTAPAVEQQCLLNGGTFKIRPPLRDPRLKQAFNLTGASWFDFRHLFTKVSIRSLTAGSHVSLLVVEGHLNDTQLQDISFDGSIVQSFWSFITGADEEKFAHGISSAIGPHTLVIASPTTVKIECIREVDWVVVAMVGSGFFLSTTSGILGAYHATLLICGGILGMLIGIAIPLIFLFNKQTKIFITAASAGLVSYGAIFCWRFLVSSTYFWLYLCMSSIFGMWWFGSSGTSAAKQVVSWSLCLLGMVLLGTSTAHFSTINLGLLVIAFCCRVTVELGIPQRLIMQVSQNFYWHIWLKIFPKYKTMITNEEYDAQTKYATEESLRQLRLYYFQYDDWRSHFRDNPEAIKRIESFLGNKDHLQITELMGDNNPPSFAKKFN